MNTLTPKNDQPTYAMLADIRDRALIAERERDEAREERDKTIAMLWRLNVAATDCYNGAFDYSDLCPREKNVLPIINEVEEFLENVKLTH
jgi:hypothetical protein